MSRSTTDQQTSAASVAPKGENIVEIFWAGVKDHPDRTALRRRGAGGGWTPLSWAEYGRAVEEIAAALVELGIAHGDRVAVLSGNRPEWHQADLAALTVGAVSVPVYQTLSPQQVSYVLGHSATRVVFVENAAQRDKVLEVVKELPALERVVLFDGQADGDDALVTTLDALRETGAARLAAEPGVLEGRRQAIDPDALATLVYTSGTTGPPKGTMLSHRNIVWTLHSILDVVPLYPEDRFFSYLPLSHIAERVVSHFGQIAAGGETWFAQSIQTLADDIPACRPTVFFGVPRVWQKLQQKVVEHVHATSGPKGALAKAYLSAAEATGENRDSASIQYKVLDKLVGAKIRGQLGLDKARILVSAAAPIHPSLLRWFHGVGLPVIEVYGQTEDCGPTTINPPGRVRIGSAGLPMPGVELRLEEDGEILVQGGNVCQGYYNDPEGTAALLDAQGWMHSGDVGRIDEDGYLWITDRKKDLIINAAGKNIAPQELETRLKVEPLISQAVVIGEGRRYLVALLTVDPDAAKAWGAEHGKTAPPEALLDDPDLQAEVAASVARVNSEHAQVEQIKKWKVLPHDLSMDNDELTPTLKVKRKVIDKRYADVITELYK